jgi:hypothetical protein
MMNSKWRRLRVPASSLVLGTGVACAVGIGSTWASAAFSESITVCVVVALYLSGRGETDAEAVLGSRADERQDLVRLQAANLSLAVTVVAVVGACIISAAAGAAFWPYEVLAVLLGISYLVGLSRYSFRQDAGAGAPHHDDVASRRPI